MRLLPFGLAEGGRLLLDGVDLADVADGLAGRPAWVISAEAVLAACSRALGRRRAVTLEVGAIGPPAVLALLAKQGVWAAVASGHELRLARQAGFATRRIVVRAPALDDGFILEALTERLAVLECRRAEERSRVTRIAASLNLSVPKATGAPPLMPPQAFARCGGLLARLLSGPPRLVLDALWEPAAGGGQDGRRAGRRGAARPGPLVLPVAALAATTGAKAGRSARLAGLTTRRPVVAWLLGATERGGWVVVPDPAALAVRPPNPAWPVPRAVLVQGGLWRELDARPLPPAD